MKVKVKGNVEKVDEREEVGWEIRKETKQKKSRIESLSLNKMKSKEILGIGKGKCKHLKYINVLETSFSKTYFMYVSKDYLWLHDIIIIYRLLSSAPFNTWNQHNLMMMIIFY